MVIYDGSLDLGDSSDESRWNSQYIFQLDLILARLDIVCEWHVILLTQKSRVNSDIKIYGLNSWRDRVAI